MGGERQLKNFALGLLGTFVSRNNDIGGYWGLGVLRSYAERQMVNLVRLDLMSDSLGESRNPIELATAHHRQWLLNRFGNANIAPTLLSSAIIELRFSTFEEFPDVVRDTRGEPYQCSVALTTCKGSIYAASKVGVCAMNNPRVDRRRAMPE
jgi:hypothetical protein